jgi:uncharacterized protein with GYD domain
VPKYLLQAAYTSEGIKGLIKDGGSRRRELVEQFTSALGGTIEAFYFAFGDSDAIIIADLPTDVTASALAMAVNASGAVTLKTTVLLTAEQVDKAAQMGVVYRPPGQ